MQTPSSSPNRPAHHNVRGAVVAITGGARGIGRATAEAFLARGARVAIGDIDAELAGTTARELAGMQGAEVRSWSLDVTDRTSVATFLDRVEHDLGTVDVLVNNAGIMPTGAFLEESESMTERMLSINLRGVIDGSRVAGARFTTRGHGSIINIASLAGVLGVPGVATYCATKHAVVGFSEALHREFRDAGVHVGAVLPGVVRTELSEGTGFPSWLEWLTTVDPEDVAEAVVRAVGTGKPKVTVPARLGAVLGAVNALPERAKRAAEKATRLDSAFLQAEPTARDRYHQRLTGGSA
ncbi:Short-chain dehydrogenase [Haloechinothrix alba]|uniref:Short-chain dehydrogenase n=1 Tax=Haloechinothrix alba TaxID=664784 RepID=A0A238VSW2_9PSEU|nr:SDR family oxidoreductase [Haloechinothrix alba]SNR37244.1 Short-chain dehydrogenase [Haloechinothrix alba]